MINFGEFEKKTKIAIVVVSTIALIATCFYYFNKTSQISSAPTLTFSSGDKPFVQINFDYTTADTFSIYRSVDDPNNWTKIISDFPSSAHTAVDFDFPRDATKLYYRITSTDKDGNESRPSEVVFIDIAQPTHTVVPPQADTSTWKTYTNTQYGFEFKYPSDWVAGDRDWSNYVISISSPETVKERVNCYEGCESDLSIYYFSSFADIPDIKQRNVKASTLQEYIYNPDSVILSPNPVMFARQQGFEMQTTGLSSYYTIMVEKDGHIYEIIFGKAQSKSDLIEVYNQILSTFKFTESQVATSAWKTYTNAQYGFELKYPSNFYEETTGESEGVVQVLSIHDFKLGENCVKTSCVYFSIAIARNKIPKFYKGAEAPKTNTELAGYPAERFQMGDQGVYLQLEKDGNWYNFIFTFNPRQQIEAEKLLDQILSTFKFTK